MEAAKDKKGWPWTEETDSSLYASVSSWPKITIVTPSFNQGAFIEETIRSVLMQNYPHLEYIIIDGGSTDNTVEIIKQYEKHITYWVSEKDKGQSHAINKGLQRMTGDVFNWLCSDDYLEKDALYRIGKAFAEQPGIQCYSGRLRKFKGDATLGYYENMLFPSWLETVSQRVLKQPSVFFGKEAIKTFGPLNQTLHYCMDADWLVKFFFTHKREQIFEENVLIAHYRLHDVSKTVSASASFIAEDAALMHSIAAQAGLDHYMRILEMLPRKQGVTFDKSFVEKADKELVERLLFWFCLRIATQVFTEKDFLFAKHFLKHSGYKRFRLFPNEETHIRFLERYVSNSNWFFYRVRRWLEWRIRKRYLEPY
jgi:glycosyltransferase involved in cell wall biosynthesis